MFPNICAPEMVRCSDVPAAFVPEGNSSLVLYHFFEMSGSLAGSQCHVASASCRCSESICFLELVSVQAAFFLKHSFYFGERLGVDDIIFCQPAFAGGTDSEDNILDSSG